MQNKLPKLISHLFWHLRRQVSVASLFLLIKKQFLEKIVSRMSYSVVRSIHSVSLFDAGTLRVSEIFKHFFGCLSHWIRRPRQWLVYAKNTVFIYRNGIITVAAIVATARSNLSYTSLFSIGSTSIADSYRADATVISCYWLSYTDKIASNSWRNGI